MKPRTRSFMFYNNADNLDGAPHRRHGLDATTPDKMPGLLDTAEPYAGQGVPIPDEAMFGAKPRNGWDGAQDAKIRSVAVVEPMCSYPLREQNREYLYELGMVYGREGYDWQNPYAWASRGVLEDPNPNTSGLEPGIGGVGLGQSPADIALNVRSTAHVLAV